MSERRLIPRSVPRKSATNGFAGSRRISAGEPYCSRMATLAEDRDPVAELDRFVDVVGHERDGLVEALLQGEQFILEAGAHDGIDRAERFVHQQHGGVGSEGPRHADPLALPSGELCRIPIEHARVERDEVGQLVDTLLDLRLVPVEETGHGGDVLPDCPVREQPDLLDDVADAPPELVDRNRLDRPTVDADGSRRRLDETVDHLEGRRLPAARRPDEHDDLTAVDVEVQAVDCGRRGTRECLGEVLEVDHRS